MTSHRTQTTRCWTRQHTHQTSRSIGYKYVGDERVAKDRKRNAAYYILIFASKHPKSEEFWTKIARDEPRRQRGFPF
jgi:hypothetical protein